MISNTATFKENSLLYKATIPIKTPSRRLEIEASCWIARYSDEATYISSWIRSIDDHVKDNLYNREIAISIPFHFSLLAQIRTAVDQTRYEICQLFRMKANHIAELKEVYTTLEPYKDFRNEILPYDPLIETAPGIRRNEDESR